VAFLRKIFTPHHQGSFTFPTAFLMPPEQFAV